MHFFAKCNSGRIAIQWFHIKHYLDYQYTKFQPYTSRVQKMCVFARYATLVPRLLVDLFHAILNSGFFPSQWSEGIIVPLFKKHDPNDVNNYRGITLVSCFSKIFTGILNNRLKNWAENNSIISDSQFGFRKGRSTTDACFVLNAIIQKILNEKGRLYCAFIDFRKAFDSVYLNGLWFKLYKLGINGKLLTIIRDMYNNVKTCVRNCNSLSDFSSVLLG